MQDDWFKQEMDRLIDESQPPVQRPSLFAGGAFYWMTAVAFALMQLGIAPLYALIGGARAMSPTAFSAVVQTAFYLLALFLPVVLYLIGHRRTAWAFRLNPVSPSRALLCAVTAGAGFLAANFLTLMWTILLEAFGANPAAVSVDVASGNLALDIFLVAVLPGVCEELLFRGMVLATYERWGAWKAIWMSAALFTGLHGSVAGIPAELMLGVALGYVAVATNSLYASMMLHTAYNAVTLIASYALSGEAEAPAAGATIGQPGGPGGVMMMALLAALFVLAFVFCLKLFDRMRRRDGMPFGGARVKDRDSRLSRADVVLLASALATVAWFYVQDAMQLFGGMA